MFDKARATTEARRHIWWDFGELYLVAFGLVMDGICVRGPTFFALLRESPVLLFAAAFFFLESCGAQ